MKIARLVVLGIAVVAGGAAALLAGRSEAPPPAAPPPVAIDTVDGAPVDPQRSYRGNYGFILK